VLVVDDEPDVRQLTALNLRGFEFGGRPLILLEADSVAAAQRLLREQPDIAVALIDVVMETDDAGLKLVAFIRNELRNAMMRLVIRTGQPGLAPERYVIDNFDIDDYKDKTELTAQKLYTTVRAALKSFRDLQTIELNRIGLRRILDVTPELYNLERAQLEDYFRGLLIQLIGFCNLGHSALISTIDGLMATLEGEDISIRAGTGELDDAPGNAERRREIVELCSQAIQTQEAPRKLRSGAMVMPLRVRNETFGFVYLEAGETLRAVDGELIQILANQCAAAMHNFFLHRRLEESYDQAIDMLAEVAEFKDSATGSHIRRIEEYTRRLALELGLDDKTAMAYAHASSLHDVGKVGIPDHILNKPGPLTVEEFEIVKQHSRIGDAILRRSPSLELARSMALTHHERWNGTGYPDGLEGEDIPFASRIVAVVDVFDALVSTRPYKTPWEPERAVEQLRQDSGAHFEPRIVDAFLRLYEGGALADLVASAQAESN
jgi:response regulator RpfG family c-di-GMP phosphodiesterase